MARQGRLDLVAVQTGASLSGDDWQAVALDRDPASWEFTSSEVRGLQEAPVIGPLDPESNVPAAFSFNTGSTFDARLMVPLTYSIQPAADAEPDAATPIAAVVSDEFLTATEARVGDELQVEIAGTRRPLQIIGSVSAFPTVDPESGPVIVVDLPSYVALQFQTTGRIDTADEWWIATDNDDVEGIRPHGRNLTEGAALNQRGLRPRPIAAAGCDRRP